MPLDLTVPAALLTALTPDLIVMGGAMLLLLWGVSRPEGDLGAALRSFQPPRQLDAIAVEADPFDLDGRRPRLCGLPRTAA